MAKAMEDRVYTCCICGGEYKGWGNNPWPLSKSDDERCCDYCNGMYVIPARLRMLRNKEAKA